MGTLTFLSLISCNKEETIDFGDGNNDSQYAAQATVSSSDADFVSSAEGGTINFKAEGGTVAINVSCGCDWVADNHATDLFTTTTTETSLLVTAAQNAVEEEITGTITLRTATERVTFATITVVQEAYEKQKITVETSEWNVPAKGALTTEITVEATADWTAESADTWLTVEKTATGVCLTATENEETTERSSKVTVTCSDGVKEVYESIAVNQEGKVYINLSSDSLTLIQNASSATVNVESNYGWDFSNDDPNSWFSVSRGENTLTVTAGDNDSGEERKGTITLTAGDGAENVTEVQLTVIQSALLPMILTYNIASANTSARLPLYGTVNCTVDWGDGTVETITSTLPRHTFAEAGDYDITISGTVTELYSYDISTYSSPLSITAVKQWGQTGLTDMQYAFYDCTKLVSLPEVTDDAFANVTSFNYAFYYCEALTAIPAELFRNCTKATGFCCTFNGCVSVETVPKGLFDDCSVANNFYGTFLNCPKIETLPDGLFDNNPAVTTFAECFNSCTGLTKIPDGLFDNNPAVESFYYCFQKCTGLTKIPDGLFANNTAATNFYACFYNCSNITEIPEGLFANNRAALDFSYCFASCSKVTKIPESLFANTTAATTFSACFYGCTGVTTIPSGLFEKVTSATNLSYCFQNCSNIAEIPAGLFDNNPAVTTFNACFHGCSSITEVPDGLFDHNTAVTTFASCFRNCSALESVPEKLFYNAPEVTTFTYTFYSCSKLAEVSPSLFANNLKVTVFSYCFSGCTGLTGESPYNEIIIEGETKRIHLYEREDYTEELGCSEPKTTNRCFYNCSGLTDYSSIPSGWK